MELTIQGASKEEAGWDKRLSFTYDGQEYNVLLHWDTYDGYDLNFLDEKGRFTDTPDWAILFEDEIDDSLEGYLDELSDQVLEA